MGIAVICNILYHCRWRKVSSIIESLWCSRRCSCPFSNVALWQVMYSSKIYNRFISIVWSKRLRLLYFLTLGYVNVYLLNLYYIRFKYSLYELTQYRVNVIYSALVMFPILNIPVYIVAIRRSNNQLSFGLAAKLYLQGRLATYLIQTDYTSLKQT